MSIKLMRLCAIGKTASMIYWSEFLATDPEVPGSIPSTTKKSSGSGTGSATPVWKGENTAVGIRHADHVSPSIRNKLTLTSLSSGGRSVGIVRLRTEAIGFVYVPLVKFSFNNFPLQFQLPVCQSVYQVGKDE
jgi:hypothetical protein